MALTPIERQLATFLGQYVTEHKREHIERVLRHRTRHVTVVLENIYQPQNASAAVRTCECFGIQDIHVIENTSTFEVNRHVLRGSNKWVNIYRHRKKSEDNTVACFATLREKGYRILATDPAMDGVAVGDLPVTDPVALVFGNELNGLSGAALSQSDARVRIPMVGFTESLNISASVAVCLAVLMPRVAQLGHGLGEEEKDELRLAWYRRIVRRSQILEKEFVKGLTSRH